MDVLLERGRVAVVEVEARRPRGELVRELVPRHHDLEDAVHVRRVDPVEVDRVRVRAGVDEAHAQEVVLGRPDHRARDRAVVRPGGEEDAGRDLELLVGRDQRVAAHATGRVRQRARRVEEGVEIVRPADRRGAFADHRRVAHRGAPVVGGGRAVGRVVVRLSRCASPLRAIASPSGAAASGAVAQSRRRRVSLGTPKL